MKHSVFSLHQHDAGRVYGLDAPDHRTLQLSARAEDFHATLVQCDTGIKTVLAKFDKNLVLPPFAGFFEKHAGFGGALRFEDEINGMLHWTCPLPRGRLDGDDFILTRETWMQATALAATIHVWLRIVNNIELSRATEGRPLQHIGIQTMVDVRGSNNASLGVYRSPTFRKAVAELLQREDASADLVNLMERTYNYLWPLPSDDDDPIAASPHARRFFLQSHDEWISIDLPNRSGLGSYDQGRPDNLTSHNVDNVIQQLTLILVLARMCWHLDKQPAV